MIRKALGEPLLHFFLIGAILFAVFALRNPDAGEAEGERIIRVDEGDIERLRQNYEAVWNRAPTEEALAGLVENYVYEEVLVREALALGMDQNDAVIRQRLRQKMEFLASAAADAVQPTDAEIAAYYEDHAADYTRPARIGFQQIYLGDTASQADVAALKAALDGGADWRTQGRMSLLPPEVPPSGEGAISGQFGPRLFEALSAAQEGAWIGPVASGYGLHLVRITEKIPAETLPLEQVRERVLADLKQARAEEMAEKQREFLMSRYTVERVEAAQ
ncbi:periplasmic folding chaperone [Pseudoruegeria aquimaris]|uniref:Parvulin-like PPIase n=1 Tax=Pseudoruegeria aquimaris TaxID=393663 RepID=A0A1Y5THT6_9RHOB|nr:peptidylprolyl isomerase [Pseudoruegeria aquimaris]SLN64274.1 periplasmic folding chaperone [Pseudoruegeria aquimaris]